MNQNWDTLRINDLKNFLLHDFATQVPNVDKVYIDTFSFTSYKEVEDEVNNYKWQNGDIFEVKRDRDKDILFKDQTGMVKKIKKMKVNGSHGFTYYNKYNAQQLFNSICPEPYASTSESSHVGVQIGMHSKNLYIYIYTDIYIYIYIYTYIYIHTYAT